MPSTEIKKRLRIVPVVVLAIAAIVFFVSRVITSYSIHYTKLYESGTILALPLFSRDEVAGFIALARPLNEKEIYTYEDYDLMKTLARQAYSLILNLRLSDELSQAREMEMMGKISSFVIHDLKNLVSSLSLMVQNAAAHINNRNNFV